MPDEDRPLTSYEVDADSVRVHDPNPDAPDHIVRRFGGTRVPEHVEHYEVAKGRKGRDDA